VAGILQAISDRSLAAIHAFAQSPPSSRAWLDDVDRAMAFGNDLELAALGPDAPGPFDSTIPIDPTRQQGVEALLPRGDQVVVPRRDPAAGAEGHALRDGRRHPVVRHARLASSKRSAHTPLPLGCAASSRAS
jgi:hypothetical protein